MIKRAKCGENLDNIKKENIDYTIDNEKILRIGFINIAGLKYKIEEIKKMTTDKKTDILGIAETWLGPRDNINLAIIDRKDDTEIRKRHNCQNLSRRGMAIIRNDNIKLYQWKKIDNLPENIIGIVTGDITILYIYFPPNESERYINILKDIIVRLNISKGVILGDLNIRGYEKYNRKLPTKEYTAVENVLNSLDFTKEEYMDDNIPSFKNMTGCSTPDHIFSKNLNIKSCYIDDTITISDHHPIFIDIVTDKKIKDDSNKEMIRETYSLTEKQLENACLINKYNTLFSIKYKLLTKDKIDITDIDQNDKDIVDSIIFAYKNTFKNYSMLHKQKKNKKNILSDEVLSLIKTRKTIKNSYLITKNFDTLIKLREIQLTIKELIKKEKRINWIKYIKDLNTLSSTDLLKKVCKINKKSPNIENSRLPNEEILQNILPGAITGYSTFEIESTEKINDIDNIARGQLRPLI